MSPPVEGFAWGGLIGIPFEADGTDPVRDKGVDCYGAARLALRLFGVELPESPGEALASADALAFPLTLDDPTRPGDLVELDGSGELSEVHLGVAVNQFEFFHATRAAGTVISKIDAWDRAGKLRRRLRLRRLA